MRFVEDDGVRGRQQFGHAGVAQHDVGEEQMVIHHDDVRLLRLAARLHHEAFLVMRAFLAETVVARGRDHRPDRRSFRHAREFGLVAGARDLRETDDLLQMRRVLARRQAAVVGGALQVVVAQVVRAALEHRDRHRHRERVAHGRDVALEELILQMLRARSRRSPCRPTAWPARDTRRSCRCPCPPRRSACSRRRRSPLDRRRDADVVGRDARVRAPIATAELARGTRCASNIAGSGIARPDASIAAATARAISICDARER